MNQLLKISFLVENFQEKKIHLSISNKKHLQTVFRATDNYYSHFQSHGCFLFVNSCLAAITSKSQTCSPLIVFVTSFDEV